jgi:hypothetical protein
LVDGCFTHEVPSQLFLSHSQRIKQMENITSRKVLGLYLECPVGARR